MKRSLQANLERWEILSVLETILVEDVAWLEVNQFRAGLEARVHRSGRASAILDALRRLGYSEDALTVVRDRGALHAKMGGVE